MSEHNPRLLRRALYANAGFSALSGLVLFVDAAPLAALIGGAVPPLFLEILGVVLVGYAGALILSGRRTPIRRYEAWTAIALDAGWVAISAVVIAAFPQYLSAAGIALIAGVALVVLGFAVVQAMGLRRVPA